MRDRTVKPSGGHRWDRPRVALWLRHAWPWLRYVLGIGLAAVALDEVLGQRGELTGAGSYLAHLKVSWVALAAVLELGSLLCFAVLQKRLLACGGVQAGFAGVAGITLAAVSIASSLPAGPAVSSAYAFRQYRRRGADDGLAAWVLVGTLVWAGLSLAALAAVGVGMSASWSFGSSASETPVSSSAVGLTGAVLAVLAVAAVGAVGFVWLRRYAGRAVRVALRACKRLCGRPRGSVDETVDRLVRQLTHVRMGWRDAGAAFGWSLGSWGLDCACLLLSFVAVGAPVPWRGLLLAYGAGQLAATLPITPGGLGVVEGSLTIAIVAYGGGEISTVAAVLLYRILSFWAVLPVGWASWGVVALQGRRSAGRVVAGTPDGCVGATAQKFLGGGSSVAGKAAG